MHRPDPVNGAREVAVSALATVYAIAEGSGGAATQLGHHAEPFVDLCRCAGLPGMVCLRPAMPVDHRRAPRNQPWRTTGIFVAYLFVLAYLAAWATYNVAQRRGPINPGGIGTMWQEMIAALLVSAPPASPPPLLAENQR